MTVQASSGNAPDRPGSSFRLSRLKSVGIDNTYLDRVGLKWQDIGDGNNSFSVIMPKSGTALNTGPSLPWWANKG